MRREKRTQFNSNQFKNAQRKLFNFVVDDLGYKRFGLKQNTAISIFMDYIGVEKVGIKRRDWLLAEYFKQDLDILKKINVDFYSSTEWRTLRKRILIKYKNFCMKCKNEECLHVDHIYPRSLFPLLELDENNLQILCIHCNCSKGNRNFIDYRKNAVLKNP